MNNLTKLLNISTFQLFYAIPFILFTFAFSLFTNLQAQEIKVISKDSTNSANIKLPNAPTDTGDKVDIKNSTGNSIITITDEGSNKGSITFPSMTSPPSSTTNKLYNEGGTLKFNGSSIGGISGTLSINSLSDAITIDNSVFLGFNSGTYDVGKINLPTNNTGIGNSALSKIYDGYYNTAIGWRALFNAQYGANQNVAIGAGAGLALTNGDKNTLIGYLAGGSYNLTGSVFIGHQAGYDEVNNNRLYIDNSFTSSPLIWGNFTDGSEKVIINGDFEVAGSITDNLFVTGNFNKQNNYNNGLGFNALAFNTSGDFNTAFGQGALYSNTNGSNNIGIGFQANHLNVEGNNNTIIGFQAGRGDAAHNKSGNVFIGYQAGYYETGNNKLYIDNSSSLSPLIYGDFDLNRVVINGNASSGNSNYDFFVNGDAGGNTAWNNLSDKRLKKDITTISNALEKVKKLRGVNYKWKDSNKFSEKLQMGFVAQETNDVIPEVVDDSGEFYSMQYAPVIALLVEAIKEQNAEFRKENKELKDQIAELTLLNDESEKRLSKIESLLNGNRFTNMSK